MIGRRFGRWRVLRRAGSGRGRDARWECVCDCGTKRDVSAASLIHGRTKSCGCLHSEHQLLGDISTCGATAEVFARPRPEADITQRLTQRETLGDEGPDGPREDQKHYCRHAKHR